MARMMLRGQEEEEEGPIKVEFDEDSWLEETADLIGDSRAWGVAESRVSERGGCWPSLGLGGGKENTRSISDAVMKGMRGLALKGSGHKGYTPLKDNTNLSDARLSFGVLGTMVYTNGGLVYKVTNRERTVAVEVLSKSGRSVASLEYSLPKASKNGGLYTDANLLSVEGEHEKHIRAYLAYLRLAIKSLIQSIHGPTTVVVLGRSDDDDTKQWWYDEIAKGSNKYKSDLKSHKPLLSISRMR